MKRIYIDFLLTIFLFSGAFWASAQQPAFTHADTVHGSITPERAWWDLNFYHLKVRVNPGDSSLNGSNEIRYKVLNSAQLLQVDLQLPLHIQRIEQEGKSLVFKQEGNAYFVTLIKKQQPGHSEKITVFYSGKPRLARRPSLFEGLSWERDKQNEWFIAANCQMSGASLWWPCKDHMYDEVDSMAISVTVPEQLMDVSNGQLRKITTNADHTRTFDWFVKNPINNYGVNINVANYQSWSESYEGEKGKLALNFYVLPEHLDSAKIHFRQARKMLKAFEHWFGPYPFYEDGYKLVEVPYLGMEHQSSVTYGNGFKNGYKGRDLSKTGWGLRWDYIIIHESGHEWFANNITYKDVADMWIHEAFTSYSESLFTEYYYGKEAGAAYNIGCREMVRNEKPIIGIYNVNHKGSGDMYFKGANMLHTIRQLVDNDTKWRQLLRQMNKTFYHQTVTTQQIEDFMIQQTGLMLKPVFEQYLRDARIPILEYRLVKAGIQYRFVNCKAEFTMPVSFSLGQSKTYKQIIPTTQWQTLITKGETSITVNPNYYISSKLINNI